MGYRDNVQAMAMRRDIQNPLREEDLGIQALVFRSLDGEEVRIDATPMNRAGRLYFEDAFSCESFRVLRAAYNSLFIKDAAAHFAELWDDVGKGTRPLLDAFAASFYVTVIWK